MSLANTCNLLGRAPTASSLQVGNVDGPADGISTDNAIARWDGTTGRAIQNGVVTEADFTGTMTGPTDQATTTAVGLGFGNQPANDGVEIVSSSASDTQTATVIGTTNGVDTTVVESVVLTGTTPVATVKTDWGIILAIKLSSAAVGTITVREASADQTITTLAPAATSKGVTTVTNTAAYNRAVSMVGDAATTKQLGFGGTDSTGTQIYDSQALTGTTAAVSNSSFLTLTEIYRGDLEVARTATVTTNGGWTLTGGGATASFDGLTGGFTLTMGGTGTATIVAASSLTAGNLYLVPTAGDYSGLVLSNRLSGAGASTRKWAIKPNYNSDGDLVILRSTDSTSTTYSSTARILSNGNVQLGNFADASALFQFPAATTSAGGISFGTDLLVYRGATSSLRVLGVGASEVALQTASGRRAFISTDDANMTVGNAVVGGSLILQSGATATALTFDSSQDALFTPTNRVRIATTKVLSFGATANATIGVSADTTAGVLTFTPPSAGSFSFVGNVAVTNGGGMTVADGYTVGANGDVTWNGRSRIRNATDGNFTLLNQAANDFSRLQFGGTTSSFPSIKRSTTVLQARLADDSGFATYQGNFTGTAGTAGLTQASTATLGKSITVENGLITAFA